MGVSVVLGVTLFLFSFWHFRPDIVTGCVLWAYETLTSPSMLTIQDAAHGLLERLGVPRPYPDTVDVAFVLIGVALSLFIYFAFLRRSRIQYKKELESDLASALALVNELQNELEDLHREEVKESVGKEEVRIFMEGAFDLMHYGHMNAFRLGGKLGTTLIVGVNSSASITKCKGFPPVMSDRERCDAVKGCRFVHEVIEETPYVMTPEYLEKIMKEYRIDYVVHGNDPCIVDGKDVYENVKAMGKYLSIPRTEGVSTTDFVGRMLLCSALHHTQHESGRSSPGPETSRGSSLSDFEYIPTSRFHTTSTILREFSRGMKSPSEGAKIVYVDGAWDMFHAGHIDLLRQARDFGDYLLVGILGDEHINRHRGANFPILNLNERVLSVMGCKYVDDVLIDCPWEIDEDMIKSLNISVIVRGTVQDAADARDQNPKEYTVPKRLGIYREVKSSSPSLTVSEIVSRISLSRDQYLSKFSSKQAKEKEYYDERYQRSPSHDGEDENGK